MYNKPRRSKMDNVNVAPQVSVPTVTSSAMVVQVTISCWTGRKKDKSASAAVTSQNYADNGTASVNKKLLGNCDELSAIQKFVANTRNMHYSMTMPWSDLGQRLIPTAAQFDYHEQMTALVAEFYTMVDTFCNNYTWEVSRAQARIGYLFVREDYPTEESIRSKFAFNIDYMPVAPCFVTDIGDEAQSVMQEGYEKLLDRELTSAMGDVVSRAKDKIERMSERLDYGGNDKKKVFRDTLVDNVVEIVDLLRVCNLTGDSQMTAMCDKLEYALLGVTPDGLRESESLRVETKRKVDEVIKSLPSLDM